ncbi:Serine/threonine-protein kinase 33 [Fasciola gigantica]|uniref:Serine/threonine-protein kinase 33 n=1 Tax=Fasciola gigantica TaxID=46835 RepID=A0A504ZA47_FASGI|nr:Serine/threonine-protein kinase 33 [Fasciola gigantica]
MNAVGGPSHPNEDSKTPSDQLPSYVPKAKKGEVVFFRMETPSQLEKEYEFGPVMGEGTFGVVYQGVRKKDGASCAIKKILRERHFSASERARLDREISILRLVKHPGIIELFAVAESPSFLFLITELCEGGSLATRLDSLPQGNGLDEYIVVEITRQVASALSYLHNRGIVHRDLKAGNIMLLNKVALCSRVINRQDQPDSVQCSTKETTSRLCEAPPGEQNPLKSAPVLTDYQITDKFSQKSAVSRSSVRPKNTRSSTKHSNVSVNIGPKNGLDNPSQRLHQPSAHSNQQQPQPLPNRKSLSANCQSQSDLCVGHLSSREQTVPVKIAPIELRTKLIDFGLAIEVRKNEEVLADACGTPLYMAPEVLSGKSYTRQCDVWSLGILMYQLLTNQVPYTAQTEEQLLDQLQRIDMSAVVRALDFLSAPAQECLMHVLHPDPAYRYSASELLLDPWILTYARSQDEFSELPETVRRSSQDGQTENSGRVSTGHGNADNLLRSRPPSVGFSQSVSTYSATNVLELMKQYHKELTENKQETSDNLNTTDTA